MVHAGAVVNAVNEIQCHLMLLEMADFDSYFSEMYFFMICASFPLQSTFDAAGIQYDTFMRTTDLAHRTAVHAFWVSEVFTYLTSE